MHSNQSRSKLLFATLSIALLASGSCGGSEDIKSDTLYSVTGSVIDYRTNQAMTTAVTITVEGITPAPTIEVAGATFTISGLAADSSFVIVIGNSDGHQTKHSVDVGNADVKIDPVHVPQAHIDDLADDVGVSPGLDKGIVIARVVDAQGTPS